MSHSEKLIRAWLLVHNTHSCHPLDWQWLDLDPMAWLPTTPGGWDNYPSTEVRLRARQGLLLRQHRAHRGAGGRGRAATARQKERKHPHQKQARQQQRQEQANDDDDQELNPLLEKALRRMHEHTPRIELRMARAASPSSCRSCSSTPWSAPGELLITLDQATSLRLQELSYEYTLEVAATRRKKEVDECPICLDELATKVRVLTCKHPTCIDDWCRQQEDNDKTCPYCRQVLWG